MDEYSEQFAKIEKLAGSIMELSRSTLMVDLRFLDTALSALELMPQQKRGYATDGKTLAYFAPEVIRSYKAEREKPARDLLHIVLHCIYRHNFVHTLTDKPCWNLACDIAVENSITELGLHDTAAAREQRQRAFIERLKDDIKQLTAERIYRWLMDKKLSETEMRELEEMFLADEHGIWYEQSKRDMRNDSDAEGDSDSESPNGNNDGDSPADKADEELEQMWKEISEHIETDLDTFSKQQGSKAGAIIQNLREVNREKYDYAAFLKKFAVSGEALKINDDEFDYIFYTYGLKLYENMPLVEPLEYKEIKRIREFVIAIDTSGSVSGDTVQRFIQKTYNILKAEDSFFSKINLHIIQCDAEIQSDTKITTAADMERCIASIQLKGFGGTDFRPVFEYVEKLRAEKELTDIKGLIYFTDGFGTFPAKKPDYDTAFVFVEDGNNNYDVPPWAIKLILTEEEI